MARPLVIAHRGASGERPEHTRAAYELAIDQGADFIEPDLVLSKDGVLVVRHENEISGTTDIADHAAFAGRRTSRAVDGVATSGWFTEDFTLAELKTLHARERLPALRPGNTAFTEEPILTFDEVLDIARAGSARTGRIIGVAPELKHPSHFAALGLGMEDAFVAFLEARGLTGAHAPILIQCFEAATLKRLRARIAAPLLQLIAAADPPADLAAIARYADWIGVEARLIEPSPGAPTALIAEAHAVGLRVAAWTFRAEPAFLPPGDAFSDRVARFAGYGVDAIFTDHPGLIL